MTAAAASPPIGADCPPRRARGRPPRRRRHGRGWAGGLPLVMSWVGRTRRGGRQRLGGSASGRRCACSPPRRSGVRPPNAMAGAVAVELVHNFSLVHDEIQDRDAERHHRPTIWRIVGEAQAINVGDYLLTRALRALSESEAPSERRVAALDALLAATDDMIGGQWNDLSFEPRGDVLDRGLPGDGGGEDGSAHRGAAADGRHPERGARRSRATASATGGARSGWRSRCGTTFSASGAIPP